MLNIEYQIFVRFFLTVLAENKSSKYSIFNIRNDQIDDMLETSNWRFYGNHNQGHNHEIFLGETKPMVGHNLPP